jgi:hypothetical protein
MKPTSVATESNDSISLKITLFDLCNDSGMIAPAGCLGFICRLSPFGLCSKPSYPTYRNETNHLSTLISEPR